VSRFSKQSSENEAFCRDATKGILMLAIVIGHNKITQDYLHLLAFPILYFWHVQAFFILPHPEGSKPHIKKSLDYLIRYMTPYLIFCVAVYIAEYITRTNIASPTNSALLILAGSASALQQGIILVVLWFLPTLTSFMIARCVISQFPAPISLAVNTVLFIGGIGVAAAGHTRAPNLLPLNLGIVPYIFSMKIIADGILNLYQRHHKLKREIVFAAALILGLSAYWLIKTGDVINVSYYRLGESPISIAIGLMAPACALVVIMEATVLIRFGSIIRSLGKYSMQVFLLHQFFQIPICAVLMKRLHLEQGSLIAFVTMAASVGATALLSLAVGKMLCALPLAKRFVFPSGWKELLGGGRRAPAVTNKELTDTLHS
jgi:fucose 4-O-acetylase-like acetyltransferase